MQCNASTNSGICRRNMYAGILTLGLSLVQNLSTWSHSPAVLLKVWSTGFSRLAKPSCPQVCCYWWASSFFLALLWNSLPRTLMWHIEMEPKVVAFGSDGLLKWLSRCVVRPGPWTLHIADIAGRVSCQCSSNSSNCSEATWQIWFVQTFSDFAALYTYFLDSDRFWVFVCFFHFFTRVYFESNGLQVSRPAF